MAQWPAVQSETLGLYMHLPVLFANDQQNKKTAEKTLKKLSCKN